MFIRVKSTPNSPRKSVQIVHSQRVGSKVKQKIIKHVGVAFDENELQELKSLAASLKAELESKNQLPLYSPQEIEDMASRVVEKKNKKLAVKTTQINESGRKIFQPNLINWSYLYLGTIVLTKENNKNNKKGKRYILIFLLTISCTKAMILAKIALYIT